MKAGQKLLHKGIEVALFPMEFMKVTQGAGGTYTHKGTLNIDLAGQDGGKSNLYAPCDLTVVKNSHTQSHEVIYWSDKKVLWANGTVDYISIRTLHDDVVSDLPVGKRIIQGEVMGQEGDTGQSDGNHTHLCVAKGHTKSISIKPSKFRDLAGSVPVNEVFHINDTVILKDGGMKWKVFVAPIEPVLPSIKVGSRVKIVGSNYATGQHIPLWVKLRTHTVYQVKPDRVLLKEIMSWVFIKDIKII